MLKCSYYRILLIAALTTLTAGLARSQPLPVPTGQIKPQNGETLFKATVPVCYIQLENGQLRDLRSVCGRKPTSSASSRSVQRSIAQPEPDSDDDNSTSTVTPKRRTTPSQPSSASIPLLPIPTTPTPQPTASPLPSTPSRSTNVQSPSVPATSNAPSKPNPLAIPEGRD